MQTTSHFFAASLKKQPFVDLFVDLQKYLKNNNAETSVEFQNLTSLHLTLYYFSKDISSIELANISKVIQSLRQNSHLNIFIDNLDIFQQKGQDWLFYLCPSQFQELAKINQKFRLDFSDDLPSNKKSFIPHVTLFKVVNNELFSPHKIKLLEIINKHLTLISEQNSFLDFNLYTVNSQFSPQIQIPII